MEKRWHEIKVIWQENRLMAPFSIGVLTFFVGFIVGRASSQPDWLTTFSGNFSTEAIGLLITVFVVDRIYAANRRHDRKIILFNQLKSRANAVAIDALEQIRREGWLTEALAYYTDKEGRISLRRLEFQQANLNGVELTNVELRTSKLFKTDLRNAKLLGCDLAFSDVEDAFLGNTDLRGCDLYAIKNEFAIHADSAPSILPDGTVWNPQDGFDRFRDDSHPEYEATRIKINEVRKELGLPPVEE
jgi:uncharacterized membrane protein (DUF485 family)